MKVTVKIWDAGNQEEEDAKEVTFDCCCNSLNADCSALRYAAERFMDKSFASDNDYVTPMYVNARTPEGALIRFEVSAQETVEFHATPLP